MHRHKTGQQSNSKVITPTKTNKKTRKSPGHVAKNCVHCKITVNGNFESKEGSLSLLHFLCFYPCEAPPNLIVQYSLCLSVCPMNDDEDDPDTVGYICSIHFKRNGVPECPQGDRIHSNSSRNCFVSRRAPTTCVVHGALLFHRALF